MRSCCTPCSPASSRRSLPRRTLAAHGFEICLTDPDGAPVPASNHAQHESCAIHCNAAASGVAGRSRLRSSPRRFPLLAATHIDVRRTSRLVRSVCAAPASAAAHLRQPDASVPFRSGRPPHAGAVRHSWRGLCPAGSQSIQALFALLLATPAFAHHPGGASNTGGAGPINTIAASTLEAGHGAVAFLYEYMQVRRARRCRPDRRPPASTSTRTASARSRARRERRLRRHRRPHGVGARAVGAAHRHPRRPSLAWAAPATRSTIAATPPGSATSRCSASGASSTIRRRAPRWRSCSASRLPTGATNRIDALGNLFETEFQPGSGSWDFLLGAAFTQRFGAWSFDANVLGVIAGRGAQDTNLGDRLQYNAAVSYRLIGYAPPEQHAARRCRRR